MSDTYQLPNPTDGSYTPPSLEDTSQGVFIPPYVQPQPPYAQPPYAQPPYAQPPYAQAINPRPYAPQTPQVVLPKRPAPARKANMGDVRDYLKRLSPGTKIGCISAVVLVFLCSMCSYVGVATALNGGANASTINTTQQGKTSVSTKSAQPTATPQPAPTTDSRSAAAAAYATVIAENAQTMGADAAAVSDSCGAEDLDGCKSDLETLQADIQQFRADINAHPAPVCLKTANTYLRKGLNLYEHGASKAIAGIDHLNPALINKGSNQVGQGASAIDQATAAVQRASC